MAHTQRVVDRRVSPGREAKAVGQSGKWGSTVRKLSIGSQVLVLALLILFGCTPGGADAQAEKMNFIVNSDFTIGLFDGFIPGWSVFSSHEGTRFELSEEYATVGDVSLKLVDGRTDGSVGLRSHRVPAKPGQRFRLEADILALEGTGIVYLDFHDQKGQRIIAPTASVTNSSRWETVTIEAEAPAGTSYVTVILYSSINNTGVAYFDNIRLYIEP